MYPFVVHGSSWRKGQHTLHLVIVLLVSCVSMIGQFLMPSASAKSHVRSSTTMTVTGTVFDDYNQNGIRDPTEPGINGIVVTIEDPFTTILASLTTSTVKGVAGQYSATLAAGPVRVLFSNFGPSSTLPQLFAYQPSNQQGGTTVAFVNGRRSLNTVDLGIERPGEYCQNNPQLVTSCYSLGNQTKLDPAIVSFPYNSNGTIPVPHVLAKTPDIGSTWGLAYHRSSDSLFAASYTKAHAGLKPGGSTGAIYEIKNASTSTARVQSNPFIDLNVIFGENTAGPNPHDILNYDRDAKAYDAPGKIGLGGLALSEDETTLYTLNLADRQLYSIALGSPPATPQVGHITRTPVPLPDDCVRDDFRPFAVSSYQDNIYVGAVCTAESTITSAKPIGDTTQLKGYVFLYTPESGFTTTPIFDFPLNYTRRCANNASQATCLSTAPASWRPWHPSYVETVKSSSPSYPQPMLTSIAFDNGDMILGLRDRYADQLGFNSLIPQGARRVNGIAAGDILRACLNTPGDLTAGWSLEKNASCGGIQTKGANTKRGPGNGAYYYQTTFSPYHDYVTIGGVLQVPGFPTVATTTFDPLGTVNTGGIRVFNNTTGMKTTAYQLYSRSTSNSFGKANGLGALVALCQSAPLEIGNRIWFDSNNNGIQDAGEPSIANVTVSLYTGDGKNWLDTTTTDAKGEYHFAIKAHESYIIKLDHLHDFTYGPLKGYQLAPANQASNAHVAISKARLLASTSNPLASKAILPNPSKPIEIGNFPEIVVSPHTPGQNDYDQDVGFQMFKAKNSITGFVFDDYNQSGIRDAHDQGVNGVNVAAYNSTGSKVATSVTGVRGIQGWYELALPASVGPVRVQFENVGKTSTNSQLKSFALSNHLGGTAVAFVNDASAGVMMNLGVAKPSEYCQNNPQLATNCYVKGDQTIATDHVVVSFPADSTGDTPPPTPLAAAPQVGSTWGMAYQRSSDSLFVASYIKRHAGLAPGGSTGAIYRIQNATTTMPNANNSLFVDLNKVFGAKTAGVNPHTPTNYSLDPGAYDAVGKVGLGGMAISEDDSTLYAMNLADKRLYSIPLGAVPAPPTVGKITRTMVPRPSNCAVNDFHPFAVTAYNGGIYVGGVCSAESTITKQLPRGDVSKLFAFVQLYTPGKGFSAKPIFTFALNYPRHCANGASLPNCTKYFSAEWNPWHPNFTAVALNAYPAYPQPMLTGIAFDNGDMVLGLRDRYGDQIGWDNPAPGGGPKLFGIPAGDTLRACLRTPYDITSGWSLEYNAACGDIETEGKDDGQGPGGGKYYYQDKYLPFHDDLGLGGVYQIPGASGVVSTMFNPIDRINSGGVRVFDNALGTNTHGYRVYNTGLPSESVSDTFGKSNGLGDVIGLCQAAPIEIGNRIWDDSNGNGIQDAGEPTIAGVTVNLYDANGTTLAQTTTSDANGEYYFKIKPYEQYVIKLDNATDYDTGPLAGAHLTRVKQDAPLFDTDSKAVLPNTALPIESRNYPEILVSAHTPGENDYNQDIGFTGVTPHISLTMHPKNSQPFVASATVAKLWSSSALDATLLGMWERRRVPFSL